MLSPSLSTSTKVTGLATPKAPANRMANQNFTDTLAAQAASPVAQVEPHFTQVVGPRQEENSDSTSYQLGLTVKQQQQAEEENQFFFPDEQRYGKKRPDLPLTFGFGLRRYSHVALAVKFHSQPHQQPLTAQEAIAVALNKSATNILPYAKGEQVNLLT